MQIVETIQTEDVHRSLMLYDVPNFNLLSCTTLLPCDHAAGLM